MSISKTEIRAHGKNARAWIDAVLDVYELTASDEVTAREIMRQIDQLDQIAEALQAEPLTITNRFGELVTHPLRVEARLLSQTTAKLIGSLRLPDVDAEDTDAKKPAKQPRRVQPRSVYQVTPFDAVARKVGS